MSSVTNQEAVSASVEFVKKIVETPESLPERCSICFDSFIQNQALLSHGSNHCFHEDCLKPWLESQQTCPLCRRVVSAVDGHLMQSQEDIDNSYPEIPEVQAQYYGFQLNYNARFATSEGMHAFLSQMDELGVVFCQNRLVMALEFGVNRGDAEIVELLLPRVSFENRQKAFEDAVKNQRLQVIEKILNDGISVEALESGLFLMESDNYLGALDLFEGPLLFEASVIAAKRGLSSLISAVWDRLDDTQQKKTFYFAASHGQAELVSQLVGKFPQEGEVVGRALRLAAKKGRLLVVEKLLPSASHLAREEAFQKARGPNQEAFQKARGPNQEAIRKLLSRP